MQAVPCGLSSQTSITPPKFSITPANSVTVKYIITNQSRKVHTLAMKPIIGVTQITTGGSCSSLFTLGYQQSCTLNLLIAGNQLTGNIMGGPILCEQGSILQCYQPSLANALNITLSPLAKYLITPLAAEHGMSTPNTPQTVIAGSNFSFTAQPNSGYQVDQWFVDGGVAQKGGATFTFTHIDANHTIAATFTLRGTIYAGTASGVIYFSSDNGLSWNSTTIPALGYGVNGIFATTNTLYVGSADGRVYSSTNNGVSWNATAAVPADVAINSIFVSSRSGVLTMYVGTEDGNVYYSTDGTIWMATANPGSGAVNSLFITAANVLYAGSHDGNIYYSLNNGTSWNRINGPETTTPVPVYSVFATANQLYVNTRQITSNSTLPAGTIDFEYAYSSNSLTDANPTWTLLSQLTYTLFVNADASLIYAGTQGGYVFSLTTGDELGVVAYSPITSLFFLD